MTELPSPLRRKLLQFDNPQLYHVIAQSAMQFAVLGFSDIAKILISKMNEHDYCHGQHAALRPLYLLWDMKASWPDHEEQRARDMARETRCGLLQTAALVTSVGKRPKKAFTKSVCDRPVTRQALKVYVESLAEKWAREWYRPSEQRRHGRGTIRKDLDEQAAAISPAQMLKKVLAAVERMGPRRNKDAKTGALAMKVSSSLVLALDLRLQLCQAGNLVDQDNMPSVDALLSTIAKRLEANQQVQYLAQSKNAWIILAEGALARVLGIDCDRVQRFAEELEGAIEERFKNGRLIMAHRPMLEVLTALENNTRRHRETKQSSLGVGAEADRLGVELPDDYKEFLKITNGCGEAYNGILHEPPLHPLLEVRWLDDDEDYFTDLPLDIPTNLETILQPYNEDGNFDWVKVGQAIEIGTEDIYNQWLIPPPKMREVKSRLRKILNDESFDEKTKQSIRHAIESFAGSDQKFWALDWGFVTWAAGSCGNIMTYSSFRAYLQDVAQDVTQDGVPQDDDILSEGQFLGYSMRKECAPLMVGE